MKSGPIAQFLFLASGFVLFSTPTHAGTESHGGGGFLCPSGQNELSELLDLWEAEITEASVYYPRTPFPVDEQVSAALDRLSKYNPSFGEKAHAAFQRQLGLRVETQDEVGLAPPTDAQNDFVKRGCELIGLARLTGTPGSEHLYYDAESLASFSNTDQAALWVHEAVYQVLRDELGDRDSRRARKVVGYLFSSLALRPWDHPAAYSISWGCKTISGTLAVLSTDGVSLTDLYFTALDGKFVPAPLSVRIEDANLARALASTELIPPKYRASGKIVSSDGATAAVSVSANEVGHMTNISVSFSSIESSDTIDEVLKCRY